MISKNDAKKVLVLTLSSGSVVGGIVNIRAGELPTILHSVNRPFHHSDTPSAHFLERQLFISLGRVLQFLFHESKSAVDQVYVYLSSPWLVTHVVARDFEPSHNIDEFSRILAREFRNELEDKYLHEIEVFEAHPLSIVANGYKQRNHAHKNSQAHFLLSATDKRLMRKIEDMIAATFAVKEGMVIENLLHTSTKFADHVFGHSESTLHLHVGGEITDILAREHDGTVLSASLPFGIRTIERTLAEELGIAPDIAHSYLNLFAQGSLHQSFARDLNTLLEEVEGKWREHWNALSRARRLGVPQKIYILGDAGHTDMYHAFLQGVFPKRDIVSLHKNHFIFPRLTKRESRHTPHSSIQIPVAYLGLS